MSEIKTCLFCNEQAEYTGQWPLEQVFKIVCPNCGQFYVSDQVINLFNFKEIEDRKHLISGLLREKQDLGLKTDVIKYDDINILFNDPLIPKSLIQKLDKILLYTYKKITFGSNLIINELSVPYSIGYARNMDEFFNMIDLLAENGLIKIIKSINLSKVITITLKGMQKVEGLSNNSNSVTDTKTISITGDNKMISNIKVFIVHGHDNEAKESIARFIEKLGLEAIILHEQANAGNTIIEKIEKHSDVGFAVVIYTPCETGKSNKETNYKPRARQNVVFEHGYLIAKLGREKVSALVKGDVETPGDISGVVYIKIDDAGAWKTNLAKELKNAGLSVDFNRIF